jgi:hypothetical protein
VASVEIEDGIVFADQTRFCIVVWNPLQRLLLIAEAVCLRLACALSLERVAAA